MSTQMKYALSQQYDDEATLQRKIIDWLEPQKRDGIKVLRICDRYAKGYSDLFICVRGIFVVAELKDKTGKPSAHQLLFIDEMKKAGALGGVCRSIEDVDNLVRKAKLLAKKIQ